MYEILKLMTEHSIYQMLSDRHSHLAHRFSVESDPCRPGRYDRLELEHRQHLKIELSHTVFPAQKNRHYMTKGNGQVMHKSIFSNWQPSYLPHACANMLKESKCCFNPQVSYIRNTWANSRHFISTGTLHTRSRRNAS